MTGIEEAVLAYIAEKAKERAARWARADANDKGEWRGTADFQKIGSERRKLLGIPVGKTDIHHVVSSHRDPLRLYSYISRLEYRTAMDLVCDLGSIHPLLQPIGGELLELDPYAFKNSYWLHDGTHKEGGVWVRDPFNVDSAWVFVKFDRVNSDILLNWGLSAEGANNATLAAVYRAVRAGGFVPWNNHRKLDADPKSDSVSEGIETCGSEARS